MKIKKENTTETQFDFINIKKDIYLPKKVFGLTLFTNHIIIHL